ncbi:MAG: MBL fold metallo-hydrolase [Gemmatimonadales bacterium]
MSRLAAFMTLMLSAAPCGTATGQRSRAFPHDVVARAVAAMGGEQALRGVRSVTTEFYGATFALGQEETPESPARAGLVQGRITLDYTGNRKLGAIEARQPTGAVNRLRRITAGGIGMLETNGRLTPDNPVVAAGEEASLRRAPERLLLGALENPEALSSLPPRAWRGDMHDGVRYTHGLDTLDLYFDRASGLPTVTETLTDDPILGDRRTASWLTRWQDAGGVLIPRQYDVYVNGRLQTHSVFTAVTLNPETPDSLFVIPDSIAARAQRASPAPPPVVVNLVELAPGLWRAEGGSHHSLIADQGARLVVVEAPQNATRSRAVLDTLGARFPGKPVGLVVNTHHHSDHAGGLRAYLAAGIPVVTHARNVAFVRGIALARKTVAPDALSRRPGQPEIRAVKDSLTLGTGERRIVLYRLPTAHVQGMLAAYVPEAELLFNSDVLSPGTVLAPVGSREIVALVKARGVSVARVAGGHGGVATWSEVERAASP